MTVHSFYAILKAAGKGSQLPNDVLYDLKSSTVDQINIFRHIKHIVQMRNIN